MKLYKFIKLSEEAYFLFEWKKKKKKKEKQESMTSVERSICSLTVTWFQNRF